jgi:hypothetical protein
MNIPSIQSEGDLEIVILHESHGLLAEIIGPELYDLRGRKTDQTAYFHTQASFKFFLVLAIELIAEGTKSAYINSKYENWSLLDGLNWITERNSSDAQSVGLDSALNDFTVWLNAEEPFSFWCPGVWKQINLQLSKKQLIYFGANTAKHHLLRLSELIAKMERLCSKAGYSYSPQQLVAVLENLTEEVNSKSVYHATFFLEMLGKIFLALNRLIWLRFRRNPTNNVVLMDHPSGVTDEVFRNMYGSVLVFKRYDEARIIDHTPNTSDRPKGPVSPNPPIVA